ncbi:MAG TPA: serine hydrolase domain-containing protein [Actinomycetes bacterium]|nr:serine hydrolase domain-containing protein [Actinomycetes bacterium]
MGVYQPRVRHLGQLVEDVSGQPFHHYLREHVFAPLGMEHTDLVRSERVRPQLATGHVLRAGGLKAVADREVVTPGGCGLYATTADMARYVAALLGGGAGEHGPVLKGDTLAWMFQPHFQLDPRAPGWGLGFELGDECGHRLVRHSGIVSGFLSDMVLAPDDGLGVVVFSNTGGLDGRGASELLARLCFAACWGFPMGRSAPTSRPAPKSGASSAAGTAQTRARSPTCLCGRPSALATRSPSAAATSCSSR